MPSIRYFSEDDDVGITPSRFKKLGRARQREYMEFWFRSVFEDPAQTTSFVGSEGGYQFIHGGPYDAGDELFNEFGSIAHEDAVMSLADDLSAEHVDWAPVLGGPFDLNERSDSPDLGDGDPLDDVADQLRSGSTASFGDEEDQAGRRDISDRLAVVEELLDFYLPQHGGIGHNNPPPDDQSVENAVSEIRTSIADIRAQLAMPTPEIPVVMSAARTLRSQAWQTYRWVGSKLDKALDGFVSAFGSTLGKTAAIGVGLSFFPVLNQMLSNAISSIVQWLSVVIH